MREPAGAIRAFVAVLPSEAAALEMERLLSRLRSLARCRWVSRAQLHVTLRFLGELPPAAVERVREALASVAVQPFDSRFAAPSGSCYCTPCSKRGA